MAKYIKLYKVLILSFATVALTQQVGTQKEEIHLPLSLTSCTAVGQCTTSSKGIDRLYFSISIFRSY